ncbi:MAG: succinate dehydrogenase assembly factor 2 [Rhizobiales bacterium]|nr:succinate dehydrogenase assembly factor 2 [Hyphomicrobiales bacterium]|tara:strand:+ start:581 stop:853 length:273 start_codon:yes stop_codon:yes gene_type:complete
MKNEFQNRLIYRSWHRGTKELDLILGNFISDNINQMSEDEIAEFEALLNSEDPDIYKWIVKFEVPNDKSLIDIIIKIREYLKVNQINVLS